MPATAVYVGRPSIWGNPFHVNADWMCWAAVALGFMGDVDGRQRAAVALHRAWVTGTPLAVRSPRKGGEIAFGDGTERSADEMVMNFGGMMASLMGPKTCPALPVLDALRGRDLACFCRLDQPCHADVLLEISNR